MSKTSLLLTTAIVSVGFATGGFAAGHHSPTAVNTKHSERHMAPPPSNKTVLSTSSGVGTISGSGFTTVASQSITTKKSGTLAMSGMVQACGFFGAYPQAQLAVVTLVDGTYVDFGPYNGSTQPTDICDVTNWQGIYGVGAGGHTVTWQEYHSGTVVLARNTERTDFVK
ncbi:MAG TPA: hypothetical protein VG843_11820 [Rhizomicrobium sp.]|jgi:hypothetical protein|nr:hypothetical protein [Rhizomicrobium sp.]